MPIRHDEDLKVVRLIPAPRMVTAAGVTASAATYGSGGHGTKGIADTLGWRRARIEIKKSSGSAQKLMWVKLGFQSGAATLYASCTPLSGYTSGIIFSGITTSGYARLFDIDLSSYSGRKRYINCQIRTCTTCGTVDVTCNLTNGEQFPPSTTGYAASTRYPA